MPPNVLDILYDVAFAPQLLDNSRGEGEESRARRGSNDEHDRVQSGLSASRAFALGQPLGHAISDR